MSPNIGDLMKQAQQFQEKMKEAQEKLAKAEVQGEAGAGLVQVTMTGRFDVKRLNIDDSVLSEDKEVLEDLVCAAINDAVRKVERNNQEMMSELGGGLNLPEGFKLF